MTAGDIAFRFIDFLRHVKLRSDTLSKSHVTVCDINQAMLDVGKKRAAQRDCLDGQSRYFLLAIVWSLLPFDYLFQFVNSCSHSYQ